MINTVSPATIVADLDSAIQRMVALIQSNVRSLADKPDVGYGEASQIAFIGAGLQKILADLAIEHPDQVKSYCVAVYEVDRSYGGPEEGGWWYDCGEIVSDIAVIWFDTAEEAREYARNWNDLADQDNGLNKGRYPDDTKFRARVYAGEAPASFPETRPHYE